LLVSLPVIRFVLVELRLTTSAMFDRAYVAVDPTSMTLGAF